MIQLQAVRILSRFMNPVCVAVCAAALTLFATPTLAQQAYPTAEAAADALVDAVARSDPDALRTVLGADWKRYIPTEGVDQEDVYRFLADWAKSHKIVSAGDGKALLAIGDQDWTMPIPIAKSSAGWRFDTLAGAEEIRTRRIGRDELAAMQAVLAYYDAQKEYALKDRNADGVLEYAQRIVSTPGKRDGLYWADEPGVEASPLGPLFGDDKPGGDYHGYNFKTLKAQGKNAPGGAYDYLIKGRLKAGFALVAWPVRYGHTGVVSFMVSHDGVVYEKDLGPNTDAIARGMTRFDPDSSWQKLTVPAP